MRVWGSVEDQATADLHLHLPRPHIICGLSAFQFPFRNTVFLASVLSSSFILYLRSLLSPIPHHHHLSALRTSIMAPRVIVVGGGCKSSPLLTPYGMPSPRSHATSSTNTLTRNSASTESQQSLTDHRSVRIECRSHHLPCWWKCRRS